MESPQFITRIMFEKRFSLSGEPPKACVYRVYVDDELVYEKERTGTREMFADFIRSYLTSHGAHKSRKIKTA